MKNSSLNKNNDSLNMLTTPVRMNWRGEYKFLRFDKSFKYHHIITKLYKKMWAMASISASSLIGCMAIMAVCIAFSMDVIVIKETKEVTSTIFNVTDPNGNSTLSPNPLFFATTIVTLNILWILVGVLRVIYTISYHPNKMMGLEYYNYKDLCNLEQYKKDLIKVLIPLISGIILTNLAIGLMFIEPTFDKNNLSYSSTSIFIVHQPSSRYLDTTGWYGYNNCLSIAFCIIAMISIFANLIIGGKWHHRYCLPLMYSLLDIYKKEKGVLNNY